MVSAVDYLVIGHVTHDLQPDAPYTIGGTVAYAALTAAAMCRSVGVLTSAGSTFDGAVFRNRVEVFCHAAPSTTTFWNHYVNGSREQIVYELALPLRATHVPDAWERPSVVHLGPVIGECDPDLVGRFPDSVFIGITPQGWMRWLDEDGRVHPRPWVESQRLLERASAVVCSIEDIQGEWETAERFASQTHLLVVTMGRRGGILFSDGRPVPFPALEVPEADPTGAGDIFAAVFFSSVAAGTEPLAAAHFAACVASHSVTRMGLAAVPEASEVAECRKALDVSD